MSLIRNNLSLIYVWPISLYYLIIYNFHNTDNKPPEETKNDFNPSLLIRKK